MLNLIYGKSGTGKSEYIYKDIDKKINDYKNIYVIVPEQSNLTTEKKLFEVTKRKALLNVEVLTLSRMAYRIENELNDKKEHLSKLGKSMIIYDLLSKNKKNLNFLGKSEKNVEIIDKMFTELKKHNISVDDLNNLNLQDKYTNLKIRDIQIMYEKYNSKIANTYIDENDEMTILAQNISNSKLFENSSVYFDDFYGFTPQEYNIFEAIMKKCDNISISICLDNIETIKNKENDVFFFNRKFAKKILEIAEKQSQKINLVYLDMNYKISNDEMKTLEKVLIQENAIYDKKTENIELFLANNKYSEVENTAKVIYNLVKNDGYKYRDIGVVVPDIDSYSEDVKAIFNQYDIPIFIDEKKDLNQNILIKCILNMLDIFTNNWSYDSVFNYLKSGLLNFEYQDICMLENYCNKWGIHGSKWYKREFNYEQINESQEKLENIRKQIVESLFKIKDSFNENKTTKELVILIYQFLTDNNIIENLDKKIKETNSIEINNEYNTSYKILTQIFEEMVVLFGDEKTTFERFKELLIIGIKSSELGKIPATQDQVILGDTDRTRGNDLKILFVLGMDDGSFPKAYNHEGYLNDQDRKILYENGIELAKDSIDSTYESNFNVYRTLMMPVDKLFLSYYSSDNDGKPVRPSIMIKKIKRCFKNLTEKSDIVEKEKYVTNYNSTFEEAIGEYKKYLDGNEIDEKWKNILLYFYNQDPEKFNKAVEGINYTNKSEQINEENINKIYGNTLKTTISRLENYRRCPFAYHMQYGLKIDENKKYEMNSLDTGSFMHEVIDEFFETIDKSKSDIKTMEDGEIESIIEEVIDEILQTSKYYLFQTSAKFRVMTRRLKKVVKESLWYIVYSLKNSDFVPVGHEVEFGEGKNCKYPPIKMQLDNGDNVEIIGKIDRIDIGKLNDKKYVRIIDYKSQVKKIDTNQVEKGLQIQLITYLDAIIEKDGFEPAGTLYLGLIDNIVKADKNLSAEEIGMQIKKNFKMQGIILADVNVVKMMDNKLVQGSSDIIPAYISKDGTLSKGRSSVLEKSEFTELQKKVKNVIKQMSTEIKKGNIEIKPYKYKNQSGCTYCKYHSICMLDES